MRLMSLVKYLMFVCSLTPLGVEAVSWKSSVVHQKELSNGLQVLVRQDKRAPIVTVQVLYRVGSSYEGPGETGISHALEHMMFRGTPQYPEDGFSKAITSVGGEFNAFTSHDMTVYHEVVSKEYLPLCLELEADRMHALGFSAEDFAKEIEVIKEERRLRVDDNPYAVTHEQLMAVLFSGGAYQHPVIGWPADLQSMQAAQLRAWYQKWYAPNNAVLVVAGDVEPKEVFQLAEKYFASLPSNTAFSKEVGFAHEALTPRGERKLEVRAPGKIPALMLGLALPSVKNAKNSWEPYALSVLCSLLSEGSSGRLTRSLVRDKALAVQVGAQYEPFSRANTGFFINAFVSADASTTAVYDAFWQEMELLQTKEVSSEELNRVKQLLRARDVYKNDALFTVGFEAVMPFAYGMPRDTLIEWVAELEKVTPTQVKEVANRYFKKEQATVATFVPQAVKEGDHHESN